MKYQVYRAVILMASCLFLGGCGDGDGSSIISSPLRGFWEDVGGLTKGIVLANGEGWFVFKDAQSNTIASCARVQMAAATAAVPKSFTALGRQYQLQAATTTDVTGSGTYIEKTSLTGSLGGKSFSPLVYDNRYENVAVQADIGGSWVGNYGSYTVGTTVVETTLTLTIDSVTGGVTGDDTTACHYVGSAQPRPADPALFDISLTQSCVDTTTRQLSGIAYTTLDAGKHYVSVATTTDDRSGAALFIGEKQ